MQNTFNHKKLALKGLILSIVEFITAFLISITVLITMYYLTKLKSRSSIDFFIERFGGLDDNIVRFSSAPKTSFIVSLTFAILFFLTHIALKIWKIIIDISLHKKLENQTDKLFVVLGIFFPIISLITYSIIVHEMYKNYRIEM
ncbi:hypothetical protein EG856_02340 [Mycoplasmopsis phocirhinis]|uniref:Uncharacterized protein n=1 Tax=Mycoplasmopsis phocirhinis TaxID=142650 RepID=A0A4P6MM87_9BACT|nr:hypothetical protein [Mycoplasmopsis phocirhinis]QBF34745.1 hypothetical protein EG856_02340 [Mycoplasmopsis phocirhinis]